MSWSARSDLASPPLPPAPPTPPDPPRPTDVMEVVTPPEMVLDCDTAPDAPDAPDPPPAPSPPLSVRLNWTKSNGAAPAQMVCPTSATAGLPLVPLAPSPPFALGPTGLAPFVPC